MDYGLLNGLAEGLQSGLQSYRDTSRYNDEKEQKKKAYQAGLMEHDLQEDPVTGQLGYTNAKQQELARQKRLQDPTSQESLSAQGLLKSATKYVDPKAASAFSDIDKMSAEDVKQYSPLIQHALTSRGTLEGRQMTTDRVADRNAILQQGLDLRRDTQASHAADLFDKDKLIQDSTMQLNRIQNGRHTIERAKVFTPELMAEVQGDISAAIAKGASNAASLEERRTFDSYSNQLTKLKERLTNRPQDVNSPEVKQNLIDVMNRLEGAYQNNISHRARTLSEGRKYTSNQGAQNALEAKTGLYSGMGSAQGIEPANNGGLLLGQQRGGLIPGAQAAPIQNAPKAGAVEDSHRFKGGDPADPKNWEKVK